MTVDWDGLKALEAKATPGEWIAFATPDDKHMAWIGTGNLSDYDTVALIGRGDADEANETAELIAALHNAFPLLLATHERSERVIEAAEKMRKAVKTGLYQMAAGTADHITIAMDMGEALAEFDKAKQ